MKQVVTVNGKQYEVETNNLPAGFHRWVLANADKIECADKEDDGGETSYWVYLRAGWLCQWTETHCIHEDTVKEVKEYFKSVVECDCDDCKKEQALAEAKEDKPVDFTPCEVSDVVAQGQVSEGVPAVGKWYKDTVVAEEDNREVEEGQVIQVLMDLEEEMPKKGYCEDEWYHKFYDLCARTTLDDVRHDLLVMWRSSRMAENEMVRLAIRLYIDKLSSR